MHYLMLGAVSDGATMAENVPTSLSKMNAETATLSAFLELEQAHLQDNVNR